MFGMFGSSTTQPAFSFGQPVATTAPPTDPTEARPGFFHDQVAGGDLYCIVAKPSLSHLSPEELRWSEYEGLGSERTTPDKSTHEEPIIKDFKEDLGGLLDEALFADVTFVVGLDDEKEEIRAHRSILCARCPTFKAMFTSGLAESEEGAKVRVPMKAAIFRDLLRFIYTDKLPPADVDTTIERLALGEEYLLPGMKKACECVLVNEFLSNDTACTLLQIASLYSTPLLKRACMGHILNNTASIDLAELDKSLLAELLCFALARLPASGASWDPFARGVLDPFATASPFATPSSCPAANPFGVPSPTAGAQPPPFA